MDRSLYSNGILVTQKQLQRTEDTKTFQILQRWQDASQGGISSGLGVTATSPASAKFNISAGFGYAFNGELVELEADVVNQDIEAALDTTDILVVLFYTEIETDPAPHESDGTVRNTQARRAVRIATYSEAEFSTLIESSDDLSVDARDRALLIASIDRTAFTAGIVTQGDITIPEALSNRTLSVSQPLAVKGVTITSIDPDTALTTSIASAVLSYVASFPPTLSWQEPGDTPGTAQPVVTSGSLTLPSGTTGRSIVVDVEQSLLPAGNVSDTIVVEEVYPDPNEVPSRSTGRDSRHRDLLSLIPTALNPHGVSTADLVDVAAGIMSIPSTVSLGHGLSSTLADRLKPRVIAPYPGTGRTLLFEYTSDAAPTSPVFGIGSLRIYGNTTSGVELVLNASWDGTNWNLDFSGPAVRVVFQTTTTAGDILVYRRTPGAPATWTDADWDTFGASSDALQQLLVGGSLVLGVNLLPSLATNELARIVTDGSSSGGTRRTLLWQSSLGTSPNRVMRVYRVTITGPGSPVIADATEITINARWDHSGPDWKSDSISGDSVKILLGDWNVSIYYHDNASGSTWSDIYPGGWDNLPIDIQPNFDLVRFSDQRLDWVNVTSGTAGANPPLITPMKNRLVAKNIVKAWGLVTTGGGGPVPGPGFNIGAYAYSGGSNEYLEVEFPVGGEMDSTNYIVLPIINQDSSQFCTVVGAGKSASKFRIAVYNGVTGVRENLSLVTTTIGFGVLGQQLS